MTNPSRHLRGILVTCLVIAAGCSSISQLKDLETIGSDLNSSQAQFWLALETLCGESFEGRVVQNQPANDEFDKARLVMHVRKCGPNEIRIPFFVDENRSRTWVITRTETGLRLKHDHRHEDGNEDEVTQYGGDTQQPGSSNEQEFYADGFTAQLIPAAATNIWTMEVRPGTKFAYGLRREGTDRRFRAEFDLTKPIETPLPPWGHE